MCLTHLGERDAERPEAAETESVAIPVEEKVAREGATPTVAEADADRDARGVSIIERIAETVLDCNWLRVVESVPEETCVLDWVMLIEYCWVVEPDWVTDRVAAAEDVTDKHRVSETEGVDDCEFV